MGLYEGPPPHQGFRRTGRDLGHSKKTSLGKCHLKLSPEGDELEVAGVEEGSSIFFLFISQAFIEHLLCAGHRSVCQ